MGALALVTGPTAEPITLAEAKDQCSVDHALHDAKFAGLILAAREWGQGLTRRAFMSQTWDYYLDEFCNEIRLPMSPVQSVTSISYYDTDGALQTLSTANYQTDLVSIVPRICLAEGYDWPDVDSRYNAVIVRFVAGYSATSPDLLSIRQALLLHVEAHYDRGENFDRLMGAAEALLLPLRMP